MESPRWLTVREAAERAAVGTVTIQRWIRDGRIGALELGGARTVYRIHAADLEEFLQRREQVEIANVPEDPAAFDIDELAAAVTQLAGRTVESNPAPRLPDHALWQVPFSDQPIPEQIEEIAHLTRTWLAAELVIVEIEATGWRFVAGEEPDDVAAIVDAVARKVPTEPEPVVSYQCPEEGFGLLAAVRIADSRHSGGSIVACWPQGVEAGEHLHRNLKFAASVVSNVVRRRSDQWLDMADVAEQCNVKVATVRRWIRQEQLAAIILGGERSEYRVHSSDLAWFLFQRNRRIPAKQHEKL